MFAVDANDDTMTLQLCEMATEIRDKLEVCGLKQSRVLTIEIADGASHPLANCLAYFYCEFDLVRVTNPSTWDALLEEDQAYAGLPANVTLKALLTHEITHALVAQTAGDREVALVDQEYIAASMELEFMEEAWRDVLLGASTVTLPPKVGLIDIWIYAFSPRKFAVNAWQHFNLPENGCAPVQQIVVGDVSFSKAVRPELR
ncbi:DUF6639 family protein [Silicimonas sp. MF1-12-2]|uniref:DUF6639 family protein n=1 Tax=Silicimonas sp. MF1-12-2 TaxID=3384793 RepID=UPI0039B4E21B